MFPYPSGNKLHMGHWYNYAPVDTYARYKRLKGFEVFQPMGFDSFGLPAENYAIEHGIHPRVSTRENINAMLEQFDLMYTMYDGIGEDFQPLMTSEPEYYRWTQWVFSVMAKEKLAYRKKAAVNWCNSCKTVLANEQVVKNNNREAVCDRCRNLVSTKLLNQWFFKTTHFKEKMLQNLDSLNYPVATINAQRHWLNNLQDWCVSRQRYWGCPIPVAYKNNEQIARVASADNLPWLLPDDVDFVPDGKPPLARSAELKQRTIKAFGEGFIPEYDTMDTFVCSSYYWLQYLGYLKKDENDKGATSRVLKEWLPVDLYVGGSEHACMHLIYARFMNMVLHSFKVAPNEEPFKRLIHQGFITKDGAKMSKSRGNAVDPTSLVCEYGTDEFRMALMFMGPYEQGGEWNDDQIKKMKTFLDSVRRKARDSSSSVNSPIVRQHLDRLAENVDRSTEKFKFNIAVASLMKFIKNTKELCYSRTELKEFLTILWSYAPHTVDILWKQCGFSDDPIKCGYPRYKSVSEPKDKFLIIKINKRLAGRVELNHPLDCLDKESAIVERAASVIKLASWDSYKFTANGRVLRFMTKKPEEWSSHDDEKLIHIEGT